MLFLLIPPPQAKTGDTLDDRGLEEFSRIPVYGYINDIDIGPKAKFCVVAVGQEPRLGRWNRVGKAKNRIGIVKLGVETSHNSNTNGSDDDEAEEKGPGDEAYDQPAGEESFSEDA